MNIIQQMRVLNIDEIALKINEKKVQTQQQKALNLKAYNQQYHQQHQDIHNEQIRQYQEQNKNRLKEYRRIYYKAYNQRVING